MTEALSLGWEQAVWLALVCLFAGMVRGFSGFALSAMTMALAVSLLPPVELIPMLWWLEAAATLVLLRGGWRDADRTMAIGLGLSSTAGLPIGLTLTLAMPADTSRQVALVLILCLAAIQFSGVRIAALATRPGVIISGLIAGIATGLASVGGMVIALYMLARGGEARVIRASLAIYLAVSATTSMGTHLLFGTMDQAAVSRGLVFAVPALIGVFVGQALFVPRLARYYRPLCLILLMGLAISGLVRQVFS